MAYSQFDLRERVPQRDPIVSAPKPMRFSKSGVPLVKEKKNG